MKTQTKLMFIVVGALIAMMPIFLGELGTLGKLFVGAGVGAIMGAFVAGMYNLATEENDKPSLPLKKSALYSAIGAVTAVLISLL